MIGPVVQRLREPDAHRGVGLGPIVAAPHVDGVRIEILSQERRPGGAVALHGGPELREVHVVLVDEGGTPTSRDEQVRGVGPDEVAHRLEDRAVGPRDGGPQLLWAEREARIDQPQRRPHVVGERVPQQGPAHPPNRNRPRSHAESRPPNLCPGARRRQTGGARGGKCAGWRQRESGGQRPRPGLGRIPPECLPARGIAIPRPPLRCPFVSGCRQGRAAPWGRGRRVDIPRTSDARPGRSLAPAGSGRRASPP